MKCESFWPPRTPKIFLNKDYPGIDIPPIPKELIKNISSSMAKDWIKDLNDKESLEKDRKSIEEIDKQMIELFNKRNKLAIKIGQTKKANHLPIYNGQVEEKKLLNTPPEAQPLIIFLMQYSKKLQGLL